MELASVNDSRIFDEKALAKVNESHDVDQIDKKSTSFSGSKIF